jgi:CHAD domain-containing protein
VKRLARWAIDKHHARILARGRAIDATTPDSALHRLRIDGKKLRYLLEFFASLCTKKAHGRIVDQLKKLQDNLGDFNDLSLQLADLHGALAKAESDGYGSITTAALGGLIARLNQRKREVRERFTATFAGFAAPATAALFDKLGIESKRS